MLILIGREIAQRAGDEGRRATTRLILYISVVSGGVSSLAAVLVRLGSDFADSICKWAAVDVRSTAFQLGAAVFNLVQRVHGAFHA